MQKMKEMDNGKTARRIISLIEIILSDTFIFIFVVLTFLLIFD